MLTVQTIVALTHVAVAPRSAALAQRFGAGRVIALGLGIVAAGFGLFSMLSPETPYLLIGAAYALLGAGLGVTGAPATAEIVTSVPLSKAAVGSAVNDTTRELGGALGIAMMGSIANTVYRSGVNLSGLRIPSGPRTAAEESIGAASAIADHLPGGSELTARAATAFTDAFTLVNSVAVGIALTGAAVVLAFAPRRRVPAVEKPIADHDGDLALVSVSIDDARD